MWFNRTFGEVIQFHRDQKRRFNLISISGGVALSTHRID